MTATRSSPMPLQMSSALGGAKGQPGSTVPTAGAHIAALDGLRGLAILLVLLFHYGRSAHDFGFDNFFISEVSEFGWVGVDLFFVLSGFLITGVLYDSRSSGSYFRNFYARRALRIFPLYYLSLIVVLVLAALWPSAEVWPRFDAFWFVFYLTNFAQVAQGPTGAGILGHFWSLAVEEHLYLVWPALVLMFTRRQMILVAVGLLLLCLCARVTLRLSRQMSPYAIYLLTPLRLDGLAVGAICCLAVRGPRGLEPLIGHAWTAMLGGAGIVVVCVFLGGSSGGSGPMQTVGYTCLAVAFGGALLVTLSFKPAGRAFSNPLMRWFGRYSYGLYIWHPIINVILFHTALRSLLGVEEPFESLHYLLFALATALGVAVASYHILELPFLQLKKRFS